MRSFTYGVQNFFATLRIDQAALALTVSCVIPFAFHLLTPFAGLPQGSAWLPLFYAPLIAILLGAFQAAVVCALLAPILNYLFFNMPQPPILQILTADLSGFVVIFYLLHRKFPAWPVTSLVAYGAAKFLTSCVAGWMPLQDHSFAARWHYFLSVLSGAWPGLLVFFLLSLVFSFWRFSSNDSNRV